MLNKRGYSIKIFFPDSTPDGLWIVDKPNWRGVAVSCPRTLLPEKKNRPEFSRPGIYLLMSSEESVVQKLYIGEGDPIMPRLLDHLAKKDFWTRVVFFTTKDESLHKAHIQYLEARLTQIAARNKIVDLQNGNVPQQPTLGEADREEMEAFLDELLLIAPILGIKAFESPATASTGTDLSIQSKMAQANGRETNQGFVVLKNSEAIQKETPSIPSSAQELRQHLIDKNVLVLKGDRYVFDQDYLFRSPSSAAAVVLGRSENGRLVWKDHNGKSLGELQTSDSTSG